MPKVTVGNSFELFPNDIYTFQLAQVVEGVSSKGVTAGNPFLRWEFDILAPQEFVGKKYSVLTALQFGPKSKSYPVIVALGFQPPEDGSPVPFDTDDFIGRVVIAELHIVKPTGGGEDRNEIKSIWSEAEFQKFQSRFSRATIQPGGPVEQPVAPVPQYTAAAPVTQGAPRPTRTVASSPVNTAGSPPGGQPAKKNDFNFPG